MIGFWVDCLSVAPFGFYITFYGWLFAAIYGLGTVIQISRVPVICLVLMAGVLLEYLSGVLFVQPFYSRIQMDDLGGQLLWVTIFGSVLVVIARYCEREFPLQLNKFMPVE